MLKSEFIKEGVERIIKITPNTDLIPAELTGMNNLFSFANISDSKYDSLKALINTTSRISVMDDTTKEELLRFIDPDFDIDTPTGSLWFTGDIAEGKSFYIQVGSELNKSNSSSVFSNQYNSYGFNESSEDLIDRCGLMNGSPKNDITYEQTGQLGKSIKFGPTDSSRFELEHMSYLSALEKISLVAVVKMPGDSNVFQWVYLQINKTKGALVAYFSQHNYTFYVDNIPSDTYCLLVTTFDGTQDGAARIKTFVDAVENTNVIFGEYTDPGQTETSSYNFGEIGSFPSAPNNLEMDEFRIYDKTLSPDEITLLYNQWFNNINYWTITIQPIITSVSKNGNIWTITGTGFLPDGSTEPTGTACNVSFSVQSVTDTVLVISLGDNCRDGDQSILLTNSDGESFLYDNNITIPASLLVSDFINVSQYIDTGYNVVFTNTIISRIHLNTEGYVNVVGLGFSDHEAQALKLSAGKVHDIGGIHKIMSNDTERGLGIHVKI